MKLIFFSSIQNFKISDHKNTYFGYFYYQILNFFSFFFNLFCYRGFCQKIQYVCHVFFFLNRISWQITCNLNKYRRLIPSIKYAGFYVFHIQMYIKSSDMKLLLVWVKWFDISNTEVYRDKKKMLKNTVTARQLKFDLFVTLPQNL